MVHARISLAVAALVAAAVMPGAALASHSWGNYHWARKANPFTLTLINSTTTDWDSYVNRAVSDWSNSQKLDFTQVEGETDSKTRRQCNGGSGTVRICNLGYGQNGWLGVAGISIDTNGHITTGYTKLNDTYFATAYYNTPAWKQSVTCQELGHDLGLGHQDENFNNQSLFSCMDYQDPPYAYPNSHDFDQLNTIYEHLDSYDSFAGGGSGGGGCNSPPGKGCNKAGANGDIGWGRSLGRRGQQETFIRIDPDGTTHLTHVTWAIGH